MGTFRWSSDDWAFFLPWFSGCSKNEECNTPMVWIRFFSNPKVKIWSSSRMMTPLLGNYLFTIYLDECIWQKITVFFLNIVVCHPLTMNEECCIKIEGLLKLICLLLFRLVLIPIFTTNFSFVIMVNLMKISIKIGKINKNLRENFGKRPTN